MARVGSKEVRLPPSSPRRTPGRRQNKRRRASRTSEVEGARTRAGHKRYRLHPDADEEAAEQMAEAQGGAFAFERECDRADDLEHWDGAEEYFASRGFTNSQKFQNNGGVGMGEDIAGILRAKRHEEDEDDDASSSLQTWLARKRAQKGDDDAARPPADTLPLRVLLSKNMGNRLKAVQNLDKKRRDWKLSPARLAKIKGQLQSIAERSRDIQTRFGGDWTPESISERIEQACCLMARSKTDFRRMMDKACQELSQASSASHEAGAQVNKGEREG